MLKITENKIIGTYINGNYKVSIYEDGTKVRETLNENDMEFLPTHPECMDVKITNYCDRGCAWCHENSTKEGKHGEILIQPFFNTLKPYTEIAIGGGNPLEHPDLLCFLTKLKKIKAIPNMTVNQAHFISNYSYLKFLMDEKLVYGLGISLENPTEDFLCKVKTLPNAVIHIINGVVTVEQLEQMQNKNLKALILGYKMFRRGEKYYSALVEENKKNLYNYLPKMIETFKVVSFDNLAIEQLNVKRMLKQEDWEQFYMGDEGQFTMYIDLVDNRYARCSVEKERFEIRNDICQMFEHVRCM